MKKRIMKGVFIFLLINLLPIVLAVTDAKGEEKIENAKQLEEKMILDSIYQMDKRANLIILGKIIKIEWDNKKKIEYVVVLVKEVYKGRCIPIVIVDRSSILNFLDLSIGSHGIFFLSSNDNKRSYRVVKGKYAFLLTDTQNICYKEICINFGKYLSHLQEIVESQPKSEIQKRQEIAVNEARRIAIQLGYDVSNMIIDIDESNSAWNRLMFGSQFYVNNPKIKEKLKGIKYWAIYFGRKGIDAHDGDVWVFIEKKTNKFLFTVP